MGLKPHLLTKYASKEEQIFGKAPWWMFMQGNVRRQWFKRVILLGPDEFQSGKLLLDLGNLLRDFSNEDRLQGRKEVIRPRKYLGEKLLPPH